MALSNIISLLVPIALMGGVIALIVALLRRRKTPGRETEAGMVRRIFTYLLTFASLVSAGVGVTLVVRSILESLFGNVLVSINHNVLALGLALTVVGTPIWMLFWIAALRAMRRDAAEAQSLGRRSYFAITMAVSAVVAGVGAIQVLRWMFGGVDFSSTNTALFLVWGCVWVFHWITERREGPFTGDAATVRRLYRYGISLFSIILLAIGVDGLLRLSLTAAYNALFGPAQTLVEQFYLWDNPFKTAFAMSIAGGVGWGSHWFWMAKDPVSSLRQVYLYLFTVLGGAVTVVTALSIGLYTVLQWFFGSPTTTSALAHFDNFPSILAAAVVGATLWTYHWTVVREEAPALGPGLGAARRIYGYLVATVGLVVLGAGLIVLLSTVLGMVSSRPAFINFGWRNPVVLSVTLLVVGIPVWGGYWWDVQRQAVKDPVVERAALSRRIFLFFIFGLAVLFTLVNLSLILYRVFNAFLGTGVGNMLWDMRWSVGMMLTAGAVSGYYWLVLLEDRKATAALETAGGRPAVAPIPQKRVIAVVSEADMPFIRRLEEVLGYDVQVWERTMGEGHAAPLDDASLANTQHSIQEAAAEEVLVVVDARGVSVVPYHRRTG